MEKKKTKILLIILLILTISQQSMALDYPKPVGYVNDYASILTPDQVLKLDNELQNFDNKTTFEITIVTVKSLGGLNIETYTMGLMNTWGVGKKNKDNGVMLLVAINEKKVRIGTGSGMGQVLSDSDASDIIQNDIIPYFKKGDMSGGIISGTERIMSHLNGQNVSSVGNINDNSVESKPSFSPEDTKNIAIVIFSAIGIILSIMTGSWILGKTKIRNKNVELLKNLKNNTYNTLLDVYRNAELSLLTLEQNNPMSVWEKLKSEYAQIDFAYIGKELDNIQRDCNKIFSSEDVNKKIQSIEQEINESIKTCKEIEAMQGVIINKKEESEKLIVELPSKIDRVNEILKNKDVSVKTKGMIDSVRKDFVDIEKEIHKDSINWHINWLETYSWLFTISRNLDSIKNKAEEDIDSANYARERGPEILQKLPDLIEKLERKLSSSGSKEARTMFTDAKRKYQEAQRLSTSSSDTTRSSDTSSSDMLDVYFMAIMANNLLNQAEKTHVHYHNSEISHSSGGASGSYSGRRGSGGFGGFGGGGSSGGGSSGGW